jgi:hypothetical protein
MFKLESCYKIIICLKFILINKISNTVSILSIACVSDVPKLQGLSECKVHVHSIMNGSLLCQDLEYKVAKDLTQFLLLR